MPVVQGRGAGLGNELVPWARAYLLSQELGAHCLTPAFGMNQRNYHRHFSTPRADFAWQRLLRGMLPRVYFGEAEYHAHGGGDVALAFAAFATAQGLHNRQPVLVTTDGMWGGILHVARAREFVRGTLYSTLWAASNLAAVQARLDPEKLTVALHVRLGDFEASTSDMSAYRGRFNCALPLDWFMAIGDRLRQALGGDVQFQIFSDGSASQLAPLRALLQPVDTHSPGPSDVSDLLAMAQADLLVCSISSYSAWAAALSSAPYVWFAPQMHPHDSQWLSIWGHEPGQRAVDSATVSAWQAAQAAPQAATTRGHAVDLDGQLPAVLLDKLAQSASLASRWGDPVRYGVTRAAAMASR
jgi:hypothetical protein